MRVKSRGYKIGKKKWYCRVSMCSSVDFPYNYNSGTATTTSTTVEDLKHVRVHTSKIKITW
jgi:hypothetical protein